MKIRIGLNWLNIVFIGVVLMLMIMNLLLLLSQYYQAVMYEKY